MHGLVFILSFSIFISSIFLINISEFVDVQLCTIMLKLSMHEIYLNENKRLSQLFPLHLNTYVKSQLKACFDRE